MYFTAKILILFNVAYMKELSPITSKGKLDDVQGEWQEGTRPLALDWARSSECECWDGMPGVLHMKMLTDSTDVH